MRRAGRKIVLLLLAVVLFSGFCSCTEERKEEVETLRIGVASYRQDDTFIASLCADLEKIGRLKEKETGKKIIIKIEDAKGNQSTQNDQVDKMIAQQYDILCINPVDRTVSSLLIDKARKANIPIIFFNREPVEEDIYMWSSCYLRWNRCGAVRRYAGANYCRRLSKRSEKNRQKRGRRHPVCYAGGRTGASGFAYPDGFLY